MIRIKVNIAWRSKLQVSSSHVRFQVVINGFWAPRFWLFLRIAACMWTISICHSWKFYGLRLANLYIITWESCYFFMAKKGHHLINVHHLKSFAFQGPSFVHLYSSFLEYTLNLKNIYIYIFYDKSQKILMTSGGQSSLNHEIVKSKVFSMI